MKFRRQLKDLIACKVAGVCARDQIVTNYLAHRAAFMMSVSRSGHEVYRAEHDLPQCPPICDEESGMVQTGHGLADDPGR